MTNAPTPSTTPSRAPRSHLTLVGWGILIALGVAVVVSSSPQQAGAFAGYVLGTLLAIFLIYRYLGTPLLKKSHLSEKRRTTVALLIAGAVYVAVVKVGYPGKVLGIALAIFIALSALDEWRIDRRDHTLKD